ncbi:MAG: hypothetical protein IJN02_11580 [Bacteroidales bacterium]|nr:hypothetical protein [Bacteroidales bacterium]
MKKYFVAAVCVLLSVAAMAKKESPVRLESGSLDVFVNGGTYNMVFDYSNLSVEGTPIADFLASKDDKFRNDWETLILPESENFACSVPMLATKQKLTPLQAGTPDYTFKVVMGDIYLGNAGQMFNPFSSATAGGAILNAKMYVVDNATNEVVCVLLVDEVQGVSAFSDKDRLIVAWNTVGAFLKKYVKKNA